MSLTKYANYMQNELARKMTTQKPISQPTALPWDKIANGEWQVKGLRYSPKIIGINLAIEFEDTQAALATINQIRLACNERPSLLKEVAALRAIKVEADRLLRMHDDSVFVCGVDDESKVGVCLSTLRRALVASEIEGVK